MKVKVLDNRNVSLSSNTQLSSLPKHFLKVEALSEKNTFVTKRNETLLGKCERLQKEIASTSGTTKEEVETWNKKAHEADRQVREKDAQLKAVLVKVDANESRFVFTAPLSF